MGTSSSNTQPDKDKAASERPVPSQAEGDLETVEEDLDEQQSPKDAAKK